MKRLLVLVAMAVLAGGAGLAYWRRSAGPASTYQTAKVERGDLLMTISATGTVEPEELVDVGAQVAGKIRAFGYAPDGSGKLVDYGTVVEEGTVLAQIDDALYQSDVAQSRAQLEQVKANVLRAEADLEQMRAKLVQAAQNWKRAQELGPSRALAASDYDAYQAAYETAKATVAVGEATVVQAQKAVLQAEASLQRAETNLGYCTIKSPVNGIIIDRRVNTGQTVVASLNAPSLFLIAKDLKKLQVWASVNEADIGRIHPGQPVRFTVDAYPGQVFRGDVGKVRLNASMTQNVVTYTVEIVTDNSDGRLLPYLTANVQFEVAQRKDVLKVPNAALRWTPSAAQMVPEARAYANRDGGRRVVSPSTGAQPGRADTAAPRAGTLWVRAGALVRPVEVRVGLSDGVMTEIETDQLAQDSEIVVGAAISGGADDETKNPFIPQPLRNRRPQ